MNWKERRERQKKIKNWCEGLARPDWILLGISEIWHTGGTGISDFYLFGIRISRRYFTHSTAMFD